MDARTIVEGLGGTWNGSSGMARCPAHDDKKPSLHVRQQGGKVLVKCHSGCSQGAVLQILKQRGLWPTKVALAREVKEYLSPEFDKYQKRRVARAVFYKTDYRKAKGTRVQTYLKRRGITKKLPANIYLGEYEGQPSMAIPIWMPHRQEFCGAQITFLNKSGRKVKGKCQRIFLGAIKGGVVRFGIGNEGPLIISESTENALSCWQITGCQSWSALSAPNMAAITLPPDEYRKVIIAADHDEAGLKAANTLAQRLAREGRTVRIAVPAQDGSDFNDLIREKGADLEKLKHLILEAPVVEPPEDSGLRIITPAELEQLPVPERTMLVAPWLPDQGLAMIHAQRGVGKTYFVLGLSFALTHGQQFLHWTVPRAVEVLYLDGEMPANLLKQRVQQFRTMFPGEPDAELRLITPDLQDRPMPDISTEEGQRLVDRHVTKDTKLIVVDSLSTLVRTGTENEADSWLPVQTWALRHRAHGRSVLFVHHSGKGGLQRGTSRREDVLDTVILLKRPKNYCAEEGAVFEVIFEKSRGITGADAVSFEVAMRMEDGTMTWVTSSGAENMLSKVVDLQKAGLSQKDIARELEVSAPRVSYLMKVARQKGLILNKDRVRKSS